jgi:hypothetical protein
MYLIDTGAGVRIAIANMEFTLGPVQAVIAAVILLLLVWLVLRLAGLLVAVLRFLNGDETAISRWFDRNRERKGYEALADGLMALASGRGAIGDVEGRQGRTLPRTTRADEPRHRAGGRDGRATARRRRRCTSASSPTTGPASSACAES